MIEWTVEVLFRFVWGLLFTVILVPLVCALATPWICIRAVSDSGLFWTNVWRRYGEVARNCLEWGVVFPPS